MSTINIGSTIPAVCFLVVVYLTGYLAHRRAKEKNFEKEWFTTSRSTTGFALAMTFTATYLSASSFVGGPGAAYNFGFGWVLLAATQIPMVLFTLSILGKRFTMIAERANVVTVVDFLKARYKNKAVGLIGAFSIVIFFLSAIMAQFIGGATIFQTVTGLPYIYGLVFFAVTTLFYVVFGGMRGVTMVDTLFGMMMVAGSLALFFVPIIVAGGVGPIINRLAEIDIGLLSPYGSGNALNPLWVSSYFVLVCFATIGLPHVSIHGLVYKDTKSLHQGIIIGTVITGWLLISLHTAGVFARYFLPDIPRSDLAIPMLVMELFPSWLGGIILISILAAALGTIDTQIIITTGAIVKDIAFGLGLGLTPKNIRRWVYLVSGLIVTITALLTINPPDLLIWLNLFSFGGLEATFFLPFVLGLFWKRANDYGALGSMIAGISSYVIVYSLYGENFFNLHPIVPSLAIAFLVFVLITLATPKPSDDIIELFWGEKVKD
jgi:sodium/pantothenate symporter